MLRLPALSLAALVVLAALPAVQAQAGANDPKITVSLEVTPKEATIPLGGAQTFNVNVILTTNNIFCNSQGSVTVALALKDTGLAGVAGTLPTSVDVPVAANVAPPAVSQASRGNNTARLSVTVASSAAPDHDHAFTVTATTPADLPSGCRSLSAAPPPASSASVDVKLRTGSAGGASTGSMSGSVAVNANTCGASVSAPGVSVNAVAPDCTTKKSFFVPIQLEVVVLLGMALVGRRLK